ncbi:MAG: type II secretion system GspH family protein [Deltaproteobacteria bacterium]|nr:type II secretion system GspH family protein [Deltaproteobacteria bacterium]
MRGLTLIEIITVLIILAIVMTFLVGRLSGGGDTAKAALNELKLKTIQSYINQYHLRYNEFPRAISDLFQCNETTGPNCLPIVSSEDELKDVWGTPVQYTISSDGQNYTLKSLGSDKKEGGSGSATDLMITGP